MGTWLMFKSLSEKCPDERSPWRLQTPQPGLGSRSTISGKPEPVFCHSMAWGVSDALHEPSSCWACLYFRGSACVGRFFPFRAEVQNPAGFSLKVIVYGRIQHAVRDPISGVTQTVPNGDKSNMAARLRKFARPKRNLKRAGRSRPSFARLSLDDQRGRKPTTHVTYCHSGKEQEAVAWAGDREACMST